MGDKPLAETAPISGRRHGIGRRLLRRLGPGLITGAADDDPSGIATYAQAGAAFGYSLGWTVVLTLPFMVAVQEISARIGRVTGAGLAAALRTHVPRSVLSILVCLLIVANVINLSADIGAMAEAARLVFGGRSEPWAIGFAAICAGAEIWIAYRHYVLMLKWLTLACSPMSPCSSWSISLGMRSSSGFFCRGWIRRARH